MGSQTGVRRGRNVPLPASLAGSAVGADITAGDVTGERFTSISGSELVARVAHGTGVISILAVSTVGGQTSLIDLVHYAHA